MKSPILFFLFICSTLLYTSCGSKPSLQENQHLLSSDTTFQTLSLIDSLINEADASDHKTLEYRQARQQFFVRRGQMDSVLQETYRIQQLARSMDDSLAYARALLPLTGEIDEAQFRYLDVTYPLSIAILSRRKLYQEQATLMSRYAGMLNNLGRYTESQSTALAAIQLPGNQLRDSLRAQIYQTIANNYTGINDYDKARLFFRQASDLAGKVKDSLLLSATFLDMGILQYNIGTDSANFFYDWALKALPQHGDKLLKLKILYNASVQDYEAGKKIQALSGFRNLLNTSKAEGIGMGLGVAYKALGFYHEAYGIPDSAVYYLNKAISVADSIQQPFLKIQSILELENAYRKQGDKDRAFQQHILSDNIEDSMYNIKNETAVQALEMQYSTQIRELENTNLKKNLNLRQSQLGIALLVCVAMLSLWWLERQRSRLMAERNASYAVLMELYKSELKEKDAIPNEAIVAQAEPAADVPALAEEIPQETISLERAYIELQHLFRIRLLYKNPALRIEDVAAMLNVSARQLSGIIKEREGLNFRQYVNKYRILEARRLLEDAANANLKLEVIGEMSGFSNRSHFQKVFESIVGVAPGYYRQHILESTENGNNDLVTED